MKLFVAFDEECLEFHPEDHKRQDADILNLFLSQEEGKPCSIKIWAHKTETPKIKKWMTLSTLDSEKNLVCLFRGQMSSTPLRKEYSLYVWTFVAEKETTFVDKEKILEDHKKLAWFDELLIPDAKMHTPEIVQIADPVDFYTDRVSLKTSLSSKLTAPEERIVPESILKCTIEKNQKPLDEIRVKLDVNWIQTSYGWMNLSRAVERLFPNNQISSFTGNALKHSWPKPGKVLGRSGYWITHSQLEKIEKPGSKQAEYLRISEKNSKVTYGEKTFFHGSLSVGWSYRQKREESLMFTLHHSHQDFSEGSSPKKVKEIHLRLKKSLNESSPVPFWMPKTFYAKNTCIQINQKLYKANKDHWSKARFSYDQSFWTLEKKLRSFLSSSSSPSFLISQKGHHLVSYAAEIAKTIAAKSARAYQIKLSLLPKELPKVSTNTFIKIQHSLFPQGAIKGKVISYSFSCNPEEQKTSLEVVCASCIGKSFQAEAIPKTENTYANDYAEDFTLDKNKMHKTHSGLIYRDYSDQMPEDEGCELVTQNLPYQLALENGPEEQERFLKKQKRNMGTQLKIQFKNIATKESIKHTIQMVEPIFFTTPCDIDWAGKTL